MKRKITESLMRWKEAPGRKPLIINGARQVGKTYIIEQFGREHFENIIYLNMEIEGAFCKFIETDISPKRIIQYIEVAKGQEITAGKTLIFFDEIQACERTLTSLKYFYEQTPEYHIIAAGSLLGVAINRQQYSFPVGKVNEINMYPLDFEEFLWAMGKNKLAEEIRNHYRKNETMPEALHEAALELYQKYFIIGGMPEVVAQFIETNSFIKIQSIQHDILNEYIADMAKYADPATSIKIRACYNSIPAQLAKENTKFQYKVVQRGGTATIFGEAIEWLVYAGIVLKCQRLEHGFIPINAYVDLINFKLYMGDIGLLTLRSEIPLQAILSSIEIDNTFLGAMTENYVAQVFAAKEYKSYYWQSDGKAEVDFVIQIDGVVIPIEVKKGKRNRSKSLGVFIEKYRSPYAIRISKKNFGFENGIKSVPLYAVFCI
ncbi:AAA family ATPase [Bacteroidales bacterium OttesenSCG-928-B11]|nr:AAA family ATPase [Bacteroidales bacterium OttesenSCG-928-E04]MDL2309450.1 AAA family ATPase [Bacteroidales bacterium OttesenSCG-928-C03]MDL2311997.1 AAA family ATPase [Bacteroidales bacterium OttesenSCG-928-B11]